MGIEELRKLIASSQNKLEILANKKLVLQYNITVREFKELVIEFLNDEEKAKFFETDYNLKASVKLSIFKTITSDSIKMDLLDKNESLLGFQKFDIKAIVNSLDPKEKINVLKNREFIDKYDINVNTVISSLDDENKTNLLSDREFAEQLGLTTNQIANITKTIADEETKKELIDLYDFKNYEIRDIVKTFSDESKVKIITGNEYELDANNLEVLMSSLSVDSIVDIFKNNKDFMKNNDIKPYKIIRNLDKEQQLDFVSKIEETELTMGEKRTILATLKDETKESIDTSKLPAEYTSAIEMKVTNDMKDRYNGKIKVDFNKDIEEYRGLDDIIYINAVSISDDEKKKLLELCEICPKMKILDNINLGLSTGNEYINAENWIDSVIDGMDPKWSDIQKVAYIDNAIGKRLTYSPDFETEIHNPSDSRSLWKIIDSGKGVCNGISQVEKYILSKIGIETEMVSSSTHAFLILKDVEIPREDGSTIKGDTILDPTWNLTSHKYGAKPDNFCKSYEEIRKHDLRRDGTDAKCHKNDEKLTDITIDLDEKSLRNIYSSIGLAREDGTFPIKKLIDSSKMIDESQLSNEEKISKQLLLLKKYYPEFATTQNETTDILQGILLNQQNLQFNRCVVNRVYSRDDETKEPVLYIYMQMQNADKKFYYADKDEAEFCKLTQEEFESKFECYEEDMKKRKGHRPWENIQSTEQSKDLRTSSGKIVAETEGER